MFARLLADCRQTWSHLLTKLNALGTILLAYALAYPSALTDLKAQLPEPLQSSFPLWGPAAWFLLVQYAKAKVVKGPAS